MTETGFTGESVDRLAMTPVESVERMDFVAIDVETANADMASICQVGVAGFRDGHLADGWKSYVDPCDFFDPMNICVHGITQETVSGAPLLPGVAAAIVPRLTGQVVVSHTHFDRVSLHRALENNGLEPVNCRWLDSARVTRRAWQQFAAGGYGLASVCDHIGYEFEHHDALEDAKAAGQIMLAAMDLTGLSIADWLHRVERPINPSAVSPNVSRVRRDGNSEGPLFGEVLVFTGALNMSRAKAANLAAEAGCDVADTVTRGTTLLIVGDQDVSRLAGHSKSSKHRKAETLIAEGQALRILRESDFLELVALG